MMNIDDMYVADKWFDMYMQGAKSLLTGRSFGVFLLVGFLTALCYFGVFGVLYSGFKFQYRMSVSVAYVLAILFHFIMNRNVTFLSKSTRLFPQVFRYIIMTIGNYIVTLAIVTFSTEMSGYSPYIGVFIAVSITLVSGYLLSRFWVFRREACCK